MVSIRSICLFCGASEGADARFVGLAERFGALVGTRGVRLVFGGGHIGLMGAAADAALAAGGQVVGVIPDHLKRREVGHQSLTELHVVDSMHARKNLMFELSDAVIALPGGVGTLDETFEVITWKQLGLHDKPILMVDDGDYWAPFIALIDSVIDNGFASEAARNLFTLVPELDDLFDVLEALPSPAIRDDLTRL